MAFRVLVIEDVVDWRSTVRDELEAAVRQMTDEGCWPPFWPSINQLRLKIEPLPRQELEELTKKRTARTVGASLDRYFADEGLPDLVIADLALTQRQTHDLHHGGGRDDKGHQNPFDELRRTTGFLVLQALRGRCPVIVTTFSNNPHVARTCLEHGAFAFVVKPQTDEKMADFYLIWKRRNTPNFKWPDELAQLGADTGPSVEAYIRLLAAETVKAIKENALRRIQGSLPSPVPYWLAVDPHRIHPSRSAGTNIMLLDIRGFSQLAYIGREHPQAVFDINSAIWSFVLPVLRDHHAEVNNFLGDAAVAFRGVYVDGRGTPARIAETLDCAHEVSRLFSHDGPVRFAVRNLIDSYYDTHPGVDPGTSEQMREFVESPAFGMRIVSAQPELGEALYGRVGDSTRWHHTILSRVMNLASRVCRAIGDWERSGALQHVPGESFLLWGHRPLPRLERFDFEAREQFLQGAEVFPEAVSEGWDIFRCRPHVDYVDSRLRPR